MGPARQWEEERNWASAGLLAAARAADRRWASAQLARPFLFFFFFVKSFSVFKLLIQN